MARPADSRSLKLTAQDFEKAPAKITPMAAHVLNIVGDVFGRSSDFL